MDLSAYERRILNAIPTDIKTPFMASYAIAVARQLRAAFRERHTIDSVVNQILDTLEVVESSEPVVRVVEISSNKRVLTLNLPDQPFIVDTVRMLLKQMGQFSLTGFNVIVGLERNDQGKLLLWISLTSSWKDFAVRLEVHSYSNAVEMQATLFRHLQLATVIVRDFTGMTDLLDRAHARFEDAARAPAEKRDVYLKPRFL